MMCRTQILRMLWEKAVRRYCAGGQLTAPQEAVERWGSARWNQVDP
jgi:hypothetical protein